MHQEIVNHGATLLSLSPTRPEFARQIVKKLELSFPILSDTDNRVSEEFGLVFTLPDDLREIYLSFGIDLQRYNGNDSWALPMPSCFIIGQDGTILDAFVTIDHTVRPEPQDTFKKLVKLTR